MFIKKLFAIFFACFLILELCVPIVNGTSDQYKIYGKNRKKARKLAGSSFQTQQQLFNHLKLSRDCMAITFSSLSLEDLSSTRRTCHDFRKEAGYYFSQNFPGRFIGDYGRIYSADTGVIVNCFTPFVRHLFIKNGDLQNFEMDRMEALTEIEFFGGTLSSVRNLVNILRQLETLRFINCKFNGDLHLMFFNNCPNLRRLYVKDTDAKGKLQKYYIGKSNSWLKEKKDSLQHLEIDSQQRNRQVIQFLQENSNIKNFSTTIEFLINNMDYIQGSGINLNVLAISHQYTNLSKSEFQTFTGQLTWLHGQNFFKFLHLYFFENVGQYSYPKELKSLVKIYQNTNGMQRFELSNMDQLEHLYMLGTYQIWNSHRIATLTQLNFIYFYYEEIDKLIPFIEQLPNLSKITLDSVLNCTLFNVNTNIINLPALNVARGYPTKVTLYVNEEIYLATHGMYKNTPLKYIEVKPIDSFRGYHDFTAFDSFVLSA